MGGSATNVQLGEYSLSRGGWMAQERVNRTFAELRMGFCSRPQVRAESARRKVPTADAKNFCGLLGSNPGPTNKGVPAG